MATELDVVALYADGWHSDDEHLNESAALVNGISSDTGLVMDYHDIDELVAQVDLLLTLDPDHPCLRSLEIDAHGNPGLINDLSTYGAGTWGAKLKTLKWCDNGKIYLAGCNSGLSLGRNFPAARRGPVAKSLADAMRFDPNTFANRIIVYGSAGYLSGTNATGNATTVTSFSETSWHAGWQFPPIWRERTDWEAYDGARDATGSGAWIPFQNW